MKSDQESIRPMREKYWEEKTPDEKIEMLGDVLERLWKLYTEQADEIQMLRQHRHGLLGELVISMPKARGDDKLWVLKRSPSKK